MLPFRCRAAALALCTAALGLSLGPAQAAPITVLNAGFEKPILADGTFERDIPDWVESVFGPGVYNPTVVNHPGGAPEGQNVAFLQSNASVTQTLTATLLSGFDYTLEVEVGRHAAAPDASFRVELLAGGTVLGFVEGTATNIFQTATVTYSSAMVDPLAGQNLAIRLISDDNSDQIDFDDVRLDGTAQVVSEPGPIALIVMGLIALSTRRRGRQTHA